MISTMRSTMALALVVALIPTALAFTSPSLTSTKNGFATPSFVTPPPLPCASAGAARSTRTSSLHMMFDPFLLAADEEASGEFVKTALITLTLGGGLIPALISANGAMFKALSGRKNFEDDEIDPKTIKPGETFDPTILDTKYREYVIDSGATGPSLPFSTLLFSQDRIPVADIVAILGRIQSAGSIVDWENLPSTKLPNVSETTPPMWLPRQAFKVYIRKAKFLGWPTDPKTGVPFGGEDLKGAEMARISKPNAEIGDAALDAVFDSWSWGASVATPDKVAKTLRLYRPNASEASINEFVSAAVRGRSATGFAALTFLIIQILVFLSLFIGPVLKTFFDIDIGLGA